MDASHDPHPMQQPGFGEQPAERQSPVVGVPTVHQLPGFAVRDRLAQTAGGGGDHRRPAGGRLQRDQSERLRVRRHQHHPRAAHQPRQILPRLRTDERHVLGEPESVDQRVQVGGVRGEVDRHVPGHHQVRTDLPRQLRQRPDRQVGRLERLQARGVQHVATRPMDGGLHRPSPPLLPRRQRTEQLPVHSRRDDENPVGVGAATLDHGPGLGCRDRHDRGRLACDQLLTGNPRGRLGGLALLQRRAGVRGHRVEALDVRHPPLPGQRQGGHPGHPVVGMDDVVATVPELRQAFGELGDVPVDRALGQRLGRPGRQVPQHHPRRQLRHGRGVHG